MRRRRLWKTAIVAAPQRVSCPSGLKPPNTMGSRPEPGDARKVAGVVAGIPSASVRRVCQVLSFPCSALRERFLAPRAAAPVDELPAPCIARLIAVHPIFGYRRLWALRRVPTYGVGCKSPGFGTKLAAGCA